MDFWWYLKYICSEYCLCMLGCIYICWSAFCSVKGFPVLFLVSVLLSSFIHCHHFIWHVFNLDGPNARMKWDEKKEDKEFKKKEIINTLFLLQKTVTIVTGQSLFCFSHLHTCLLHNLLASPLSHTYTHTHTRTHTHSHSLSLMHSTVDLPNTVVWTWCHWTVC